MHISKDINNRDAVPLHGVRAERAEGVYPARNDDVMIAWYASMTPAQQEPSSKKEEFFFAWKRTSASTPDVIATSAEIDSNNVCNSESPRQAARCAG
jgi:hypothetical protein